MQLDLLAAAQPEQPVHGRGDCLVLGERVDGSLASPVTSVAGTAGNSSVSSSAPPGAEQARGTQQFPGARLRTDWLAPSQRPGVITDGRGHDIPGQLEMRRVGFSVSATANALRTASGMMTGSDTRVFHFRHRAHQKR